MIATKFKQSLFTLTYNVIPLYYLLLIFIIGVVTPAILAIALTGGLITIIVFALCGIIAFIYQTITRTYNCLSHLCWAIFVLPAPTIPTNIAQPSNARYSIAADAADAADAVL